MNSTLQGAKKRKTWLWVLGWIFIFPLPLTIILIHKKEMKAPFKYGALAAAWIFYLVIALSQNGATDGKDTSVPSETKSAVTTEREESTVSITKAGVVSSVVSEDNSKDQDSIMTFELYTESSTETIKATEESVIEIDNDSISEIQEESSIVEPVIESEAVSIEAASVTTNTEGNTVADKEVASEVQTETVVEVEAIIEEETTTEENTTVEEITPAEEPTSIIVEPEVQEETFSIESVPEAVVENERTIEEETVIPATEVIETAPPVESGTAYVANTNTKKFHYPQCSSVREMKAENRWDYTGSRDYLIGMGYVPCKRCNP